MINRCIIINSRDDTIVKVRELKNYLLLKNQLITAIQCDDIDMQVVIKTSIKHLLTKIDIVNKYLKKFTNSQSIDISIYEDGDVLISNIDLEKVLYFNTSINLKGFLISNTRCKLYPNLNYDLNIINNQFMTNSNRLIKNILRMQHINLLLTDWFPCKYENDYVYHITHSPNDEANVIIEIPLSINDIIAMNVDRIVNKNSKYTNIIYSSNE